MSLLYQGNPNSESTHANRVSGRKKGLFTYQTGPVIDHYPVKRTDQFWPFQYKVVF